MLDVFGRGWLKGQRDLRKIDILFAGPRGVPEPSSLSNPRNRAISAEPTLSTAKPGLAPPAILTFAAYKKAVVQSKIGISRAFLVLYGSVYLLTWGYGRPKPPFLGK